MKRKSGMRIGHRTILSVLLLAGLVVAGTTTGRLTARDATDSPRAGLLDSPADEISFGEGITIVPAELDFGRVEKQTTAKATVTLRNGTDKPIRILRSVTDCGCAVARFPKDPIAPGDSVEIPIELDTPRRGNRQLSKTITFVLDGDHDPVTLRVYAKTTE